MPCYSAKSRYEARVGNMRKPALQVQSSTLVTLSHFIDILPLHSFSTVADLVLFVTEGMTLLGIMHIAEMTDLDDEPEGCMCQESEQQKQDFLKELCGKVVDLVWGAPSENNIDEVIHPKGASSNAYEHCYCKEGNFFTYKFMYRLPDFLIYL